MMITWGTIVCGIVLCVPSQAQQPASIPPGDETNVACAQRVQIPSYPLLARQARLAGTLSVKVKLGANASVDEVSAQWHLNNDNAKAVLLAPIENALRKSQFRRDCAGKIVTLEYEFRISGDPNDRQTQEVEYGYPNHFWITTRPLIYNP
jgi:hypothetical protein